MVRATCRRGARAASVALAALTLAACGASGDAGDGCLHREELVARQALDLRRLPVELNDLLVAGLMMKSVNILGDEREELAAPFQLDKGEMAGIGLGVTNLRPHRDLLSPVFDA